MEKATAQLVRAITALGESLGITTLAGGVKTSEQLARVRSDGGSSVHGFHFSKSVAASELAGLFCTPIPHVSE